jgi:hypothetical protein
VWGLLAVIKCIYLLPTKLYFIQDIEDRSLLLTSSTSFVDLPFHKHWMMERNHMDQNPCISSVCPTEPKWGQPAPPPWPARWVLAPFQTLLCQCVKEGRCTGHLMPQVGAAKKLGRLTSLTSGLPEPHFWTKHRLNPPINTRVLLLTKRCEESEV